MEPIDGNAAVMIGTVVAGGLMGVKFVLDKMPKNGKTPVTTSMLKAALSEQEGRCLRTFADMKADVKEVKGDIKQLIETVNHMNVLVSERLSNHGARIAMLERAPRGED